ncbi:MAG: PD-(D/E)XK nuclease family protein, partial [Lachnospiraceae bacterium]|nr:PD-(D/E)XK nuclease family protein [Lachnospiraceae bacterium]
MNQEGCKVQIVYGRSGVGKTHFLCSELIERSLLDPAGHYYMIVPEQSTMEMQKRLSMMHPDGGVMDIDILSFVRLTYRVFEELHVKTDQVLEDVGKTMVISYLLEQHKDKLAIFGKSAGRAGFHEEMKSMICELFQYGIHREDVERTMKGLPEGSILYLKLQDLLLVYDSFREYISGHYIVAEQLLDLVSGYVCQSEKLKGAVLYFDGFTGFTPLQYVLLDKLMSVAGELRVSVTMPAPQSAFEQEHHLFHMGYEMLHRITGLAKRHAGAVLLSPLGVEEGAHSRLSESPELSCLEKNLFVFPYEKWEAEPKDIHAFCARTARDEITQVAGRIRRLVMDEGLRYRDIAVVSGDLHSVTYLAEEIMPQYGIPYFIDESVDMCTNPFVTWVLALWRITAFDYQLTDVVSYLKTGYSDGVGLTDAGLLENYALARNLHSRAGWRREAADARVEALRQSFVKEMDAFRALRKGKTVRDILTAVYKFTVEMHIEEKLAAQARMFAERGQHSQSSVYEQIYPEMMALFDKLVDILGEEQMSAQAFYTVLETGVKSLDIGMIPQGLDQVVLGDITRSRIEDIKVLFLINVNEGVIPKGSERGMILTERDRDALRTEIELAPGGRIRSYQEQFYLYLMLTKPAKQLYLSYHKLQSDNKPVKPSYLMSRICAVFPKLSVREEEKTASHRHIYTREEGLALLLDLLTEYAEEEIVDGEAVDREQSEAGKEADRLIHGLLQLYRDSPEEEMLLRGLAYPVREEDLPEVLVKELYGSRVSASISRLEKYAGCAFAFFLQYGLKLKERKLFEISTADTGDILHKTMELVFTYFKERQGVRLASEEVLEEKTREVLDEIVHSEDYAEIFEASNRNGYLQNILENVAVSSVRALKG